MSNSRMVDSKSNGRSNGHRRVEPKMTGPALLNDPLLHRDTTFRKDGRARYGLVGLLLSAVAPPAVAGARAQEN